MTGSSVLPVTIHKGKLLFLFGKENPNEISAKGFSDFGGGVEKGEGIYETALREGGEELTGFLGDSEDIRKLISCNGGIYKISHNDYHCHLFYIPYDQNLVTYFNFNHRFLWERLDKNILSKSKLFEKIEIEWFTVQNIKKRLSEFRSFYRDIALKIVGKEKEIINFINSRKTRRKATIKRRKNISIKQNNSIFDPL